MIKLQVIGNLGKDCIVNNVGGKAVINFSVAHTEKFKDAQGQQKDKTVWVECAKWGDGIAIAQYLKKGTQVYCEGTADVRTYNTNDGRQGASLSMKVQYIQLIGGNRQEQNTGTFTPQADYGAASQNGSNNTEEPLSDLPF